MSSKITFNFPIMIYKNNITKRFVHVLDNLFLVQNKLLVLKDKITIINNRSAIVSV
jgi:hypothetical protein